MTDATPNRFDARVLGAETPRGDTGIVYSFGTLVTDPAQYADMRASLATGGFAAPDCEYFVIDNTGAGQMSAYRGLNAVLAAARGSYVVLLHQDVRLLKDGRATLDRRLAELDALDPDWAIAGNAGGVAPGTLAMRITDPHGRDRHLGPLPARVVALDENFIVVRRAANVGFSADLDGFHFYGADICLAAATLGRSAWVIDFHLEHLSPGRKNATFDVAQAGFRAKWSRALAPRWLQTTCALLHLSGDPLGSLAGRIVEGPYARISRRLPGARGWTRPQPAAAES